MICGNGIINCVVLARRHFTYVTMKCMIRAMGREELYNHLPSSILSIGELFIIFRPLK